MISIKNLNIVLDKKHILKNINLTLEDGERCVLIGPSGEGKSVLIKTIVGLIKPSSGSVEIDGVNMHKAASKEKNKVKLRTGFLFQNAALFDFLSVRENISLPLTIDKEYDPEEVDTKVENALLMLGLEGQDGKMPNELSGGMQKRVAFARAFIKNPKYLFCDEPNSGLDPVMARNVDEIIVRLQKTLKATSITVTHDMESIGKIADRVIFLHNKTIIYNGSVKGLKKVEDKYLKNFIASYSKSI